MKRPRPVKLESYSYRKQTGCGSLYITITFDHTGALELFINKGHTGGCLNSCLAIIGRLTSIALRSGTTLEDLHNQFDGAKCPQSVDIKPVVLSCGDAIAEAISDFIKEQKQCQKLMFSKIMQGEFSLRKDQ